MKEIKRRLDEIEITSKTDWIAKLNIVDYIGTDDYLDKRWTEVWHDQTLTVLKNRETGKVRGVYSDRRSDDEIKASLSRANPYASWLARSQIVLEELPPVPSTGGRKDVALLDRQQGFGYTQEDLRVLMAPMAVTGQEPVGSMGNDGARSRLGTDTVRAEEQSHRRFDNPRAGHPSPI